MAADSEEGVESGTPRMGDRRKADRRRTDRRAPLPPWRRPWALLAIGAGGGALLLLLAVLALRDDEDAPVPGEGEIVSTTQPPPPAAAPAPSATPPGGAPEAATATADFERLVLEGPAAHGRLVTAQLYCEAPTTLAVVQGTDSVDAAVAPLIENGRVPAAVCKWGSRDDPRRKDFILLVPPAQAAQFSAAPVVMDGYVRRRHLMAQVEWVGDTRTLALRTAGVFRGLAQ